MPNANSPISTALIRELQAILREDYGVEMTQEETAAAAINYIDYFDTLAEMASEEGKANAT